MPRSPRLSHLMGLAITLAAVALFSWYAQLQIDGLRRLQTGFVDRNRRDSLQLLRIQNDLNQLGLALRDMLEETESYPLSGFRAQLQRIRTDLEDALRREAELAPATRTADQQRMLNETMARFWLASDAMFAASERGDNAGARRLIRTRLEPERASVTALVSRLLVQNHEVEEQAAAEIQGIYSRVERNVYLLLAAVVTAIVVTAFFVIRLNRRVFERLEQLSKQRKELAGQIINVQEEVFRTLARDLHDDLGQVLTAMGAMLSRVEKKAPENTALREDLREVREIAQQTLERVRTLTQMLHPPVLDDYGLEKSIDWYLQQFGRQTTLTVHYETLGTSGFIGDPVAIHVYRILQEALNNVVRHAQTNEAWVRTRYDAKRLVLEVEDHGIGMPERSVNGGIGLIAMRERAELLGGTIHFSKPNKGGTLVRLDVPLEARGAK